MKKLPLSPAAAVELRQLFTQAGLSAVSSACGLDPVTLLRAAAELPVSSGTRAALAAILTQDIA